MRSDSGACSCRKLSAEYEPILYPAISRKRQPGLVKNCGHRRFENLSDAFRALRSQQRSCGCGSAVVRTVRHAHIRKSEKRLCPAGRFPKTRPIIARERKINQHAVTEAAHSTLPDTNERAGNRMVPGPFPSAYPVTWNNPSWKGVHSYRNATWHSLRQQRKVPALPPGRTSSATYNAPRC